MPTPLVGRLRQILNFVETMVNTTGDTYFVHSGTGSASNGGLSKDDPLATLDAAVGKCTANQGDVIVVMPGHAEDLEADSAVDIDVAGVTVIGLGTGSDRPTFTFKTNVAADFKLAAANVTVRNCLFVGGIDALTGPIEVSAADCALLDIETRDSTGQATDFIVTTTAADRLLIDGWVHRGDSAAGAETALSIVGGDGITVRNFWVDGNFGTAAIENVTTAATNLTIEGGEGHSYIRTRNSADIAITLVATATGNVGPDIFIRLADDATNITECLVGADMQFFDPILVCNADGERGLQWDGTASTG